MEQAGAAAVLPEPDLDARLGEVVTDLLDDPETLNEMTEAARERARPDAAETIARDVLTLADSYRRRSNPTTAVSTNG
jgi:UDP-N-acetylglucosamine--N-acetylmuramyl-(pentapeptide) pyrophosphoryl-undecaprenol N-acetylglucosamine transferase